MGNEEKVLKSFVSFAGIQTEANASICQKKLGLCLSRISIYLNLAELAVLAWIASLRARK